MSEEVKKKVRRSKAEVLADYERRAARIKWGGMRDAVQLTRKAAALVEEARAAAGEAGAASGFNGAIDGLRDLAISLSEQIPPEAR